MNLGTLREVVARAISENGIDRARPSWVAERAMRIIDPNRVSPPEVAFAASLEFRQLARSELRSAFAPESPSDQALQHPLFPGLQAMYPRYTRSDEEAEYVKPELLSEEDVAWNLTRMRSCATTLQRGADALEAWHRGRRAAA